jgi:hypothetical protein
MGVGFLASNPGLLALWLAINSRSSIITGLLPSDHHAKGHGDDGFTMSEIHHSTEERRAESEFGLRVTDFLRRNSRRLVIGASTVLIVALVVTLWILHRREVAAAGFSALSQASDAEGIAAVASQFRGTPAAVLAAFVEGNALLDEDRYEEASAAFESFLGRHPDHPMAPDAEFLLGIAWEGLGRTERAVEQFRLVSDREDHPRAPEALISAARCEETLGRPDEARRLLEDLLARYPESVWAREAGSDLPRIRRLSQRSGTPESALKTVVSPETGEHPGPEDLPPPPLPGQAGGQESPATGS